MQKVTTPIDDLRRIGQSVWLDFLRRGLIMSCELERMVRDGWITGMTSNPTILLKAISGSSDYDQALRKIAEGGECTPYDAFLQLGGEDIRLAADVMRPVFDKTQGRDGYISFEAQAGEPEQMMAEVRRMFSIVGWPNVMIKVPGTQAGGVRAVRHHAQDACVDHRRRPVCPCSMLHTNVAPKRPSAVSASPPPTAIGQ